MPFYISDIVHMPHYSVADIILLVFTGISFQKHLNT